MTLHADSDHPPATAPYKAGSEVAVFFDASELPEDLIAREGKVLSAITAAFDVWTTHTDIEFVQVADAELAQVRVGFSDTTKANEFAFDGAGGLLAQATTGSLVFDASEKWTLPGDPPIETDGFWDRVSFDLYTVAVHEIGHVLGMPHSHDAADVMSPFYLEGRATLSPADIAAVKALVGNE